MLRLIVMLSVLGLLASPLLASAQVSRDVAESGVDNHVEIEMNDGSSYRGWLMRAGEATVIIRIRSGRLIEIERENISAIYVDDAAPVAAEPAASQPPGSYAPGGYLGPDSRLPGPRESAYVTDEEYEYARSQYYPARRLRFFGIMTGALGGVALASAIGTHISYRNSYCYDSYYDDGYYDDYSGCDQGVRRASIAMFTLFPLLVGGGMTMAVIGGKKKNEHAPTLRTYRRQQQAERQRAFEHRSSVTPPRPSAEFAVSPTFSRDGGGLRLHLTF